MRSSYRIDKVAIRVRANGRAAATFSKAEHTVVNVGDAEFPRLITCVKASQGFDWNQGTLCRRFNDPALHVPGFVLDGCCREHGC